jgi:endoplasmic reticulum chaperone BiP
LLFIIIVNMSADKIDEIILVGGSSRIAAIKKLVLKIFPKKNLNFGLNPDEAIAYRATLRATQISQQGVTNIILNESNAKWLKNTSSTHTINSSEIIVSAIKVREVRIPTKFFV